MGACKGKITQVGDEGNCEYVGSDCCYGGCNAFEYYSCAQYSIIHTTYANSIDCPECGENSDYGISGISRAPSEAWGVGARWLVENHTWTNGSNRVLFFIGDGLPTGTRGARYDDYDEDNDFWSEYLDKKLDDNYLMIHYNSLGGGTYHIFHNKK